MRHGRLKRIRKAVTFYKVVFQFREPFKVLLDGNFLHAFVTLKLGDVREAVAKLLGAQARVFVTKCVQAELQSLGSDYAATAALARRLDGLAGGLAPPASAADSLAAAVGPANAEHFFVATQDEALRERLRKVPGVPQLYVGATGIGLEIPSEAQRLEAGSRSVVPAHERAALQLQPGAATAVHTSVRFKRNVAQAPNPLSAKKKRKATQSQPPPQTQTEAGSREEEEGRMRKRPRRKRRGGAAEGGAVDVKQ